MKKFNVKQITKDEVIQALVDEHLVIRINLDNMITCNLVNKSIDQIRKDFVHDKYIYLLVEEV